MMATTTTTTTTTTATTATTEKNPYYCQRLVFAEASLLNV
jgi:hypothetical protein